ncbi:unnamed protein product [Chironomus riparius]|uniref:Hemolymph juvenile hormone binding protein n=1 Tax=Chironomus riparius TaxID=315576 RepID=A0A9N9SBE6_9DIPT|nr:unnamed protein product [Chironomus riparius]
MIHNQLDKMNIGLKLLVLLILVCNFVNLQESPDVFPKCGRRSKNFDQCMIKMMNTIRPRLATGRLSRDWIIDSVDPFYLNETEITKTQFFTFTVYDIYMSGTTNFDLMDIKHELNGNHLRVLDRVQIPEVKFKLKYRVTSPILGRIPLTGDMSYSMKDFKVHGDTGVKFYKRDGVEYAEVVSVKLVIDNTKLDNVKLTLPVGFEYKLGPLSKTFVKMFGQVMSKVAYKLLERIVDKTHIDTVNRFLANTPADTFFPDSE